MGVRGGGKEGNGGGNGGGGDGGEEVKEGAAFEKEGTRGGW